MSIKQCKKRIAKFLDTYAPSVLAWAYQYLHTIRLGIYTIAPRAIDSPAFLNLLRSAIAKSNAKKSPSTPQVPHIVLYTHGLSSGGAERQWCYLAVELARRNYTVTLLTNSLAGEEGHYLPLLEGTTVQVLALDTLRIPQDIIDTVPIANIPYDVYKCMLAFTLLQPSHILLQLDDTNICGAAAALLHGGTIQNILMSFRNVNPSHFPHFQKPYMQKLYQELIASSKIILSGNSYYGNEDYAAWLGTSKHTIHCIHNALDTSSPAYCNLHSLRDSLRIGNDTLIILGVFRLSAEKNPSLFLQVAQKLRKIFPHVVVVHAGVGMLESNIRSKAAQHGLGDFVYFLGNRQDIPQLMRTADMLLLTSDNEGLPNVILEAQAAGLPVVSTKVGGVSEAVIEGKTALLAPKGDARALVAHCATLLSNAALRKNMGEAGQAFVRENFSHKALGDRTLDAIGLPHTCAEASCSPHSPLPTEGTLPKEAYFLRPLVDAAHNVPLAFFVEHKMSYRLKLPANSLCIAAMHNHAHANVPTVAFDWQESTDWSVLSSHITTQKLAAFAKETCLQPHIRQHLAHCGFTHILFAASGNIYKIPVLHPPLYKRLGTAISFVWTH